MQHSSEQDIFHEWNLIYSDFDPEKEKSRESLLAVGNGYMGFRGAMEESAASDTHYPGLYLAGLYNRLVSKVADRDIENEDFVNCPNSLGITFRIDGGDWFYPGTDNIRSITRNLDLRSGVLLREMIIEDPSGRQTEIVSQRLASMDNPHLAGIRYAIKPLNYAGKVDLKSTLDGQIINDGVARYRSLNQKHIEPVDQGTDELTDWLLVKTVQSDIDVAITTRHSVRMNQEVSDNYLVNLSGSGRVERVMAFELNQGDELTLEKLISVFSSRSDDSKMPLVDSKILASSGFSFFDLLAANAARWKDIWEQIDIEIEGDPKSQMLVRLHLYHLMVTASPHNVHIDAGIPARGLHGEAYRGHIFWDELYILPLYSLFLPNVARSVLRYRYRRLDEARKYALEHGYEGAMFPWQSGSDGREETQVVHLNPLSGEWGEDYSSLQGHISIAIAYNVWYYFQITDDLPFMESEGAELLLDICRFWASKCELNQETKRYEITRVMGPDEFHEQHPLSVKGGVKDNAYTNLMVAWLFEQAQNIWNNIGEEARTNLSKSNGFNSEEIDKWSQMGQQLHLQLSDTGILAQFEGYFDLQELDWDAYRKKYGNIYRLDRILKAEGKSPDNYQLAKQADTLMTFYNLSAETIRGLMNRMDYPAGDNLLKKNFDYYISRTSHGSTLSRVVHAYLALQMGDSDLAWDLYSEALASDYTDIQGGTTAEGIHAGVMGGTVLMVITAFAGFDFRSDIMQIDPHLPKPWKSVAFSFEFRKSKYQVHLSKNQLKIEMVSSDNQETEIIFLNKTIVLQPGKEYILEY